MQEETPNPTAGALSNPYKDALSDTIKDKFDKDADLQQFINNIPNLFYNAHQINTT